MIHMTQHEKHTQNVGIVDQGIRMILGIAIVSLAFIGPQSVWGWLGAILVYTGAFSYSPLYDKFGISTVPKSQRET